METYADTQKGKENKKDRQRDSLVRANVQGKKNTIK